MEFKERITVDLGLQLFTGTADATASPVEGLETRSHQLKILIAARNSTEAVGLLHSWLLAEGLNPEQWSLTVRREILIVANDDPPTTQT